MLPTAGVVTVFVPTVNATVLAPAGTVTVAGTIAIELVLERVTTAPPSGAEPLRTIFPADVPQPPITVVGVKDSWVNAGGTTVNVCVTVTCPYVAEIWTGVDAATTFGMMLKARDVVVDGTSTVEGTGAMSGRLLDSRTSASPGPVMSVSVTRADDALPPASVDGVSVSVESATAQFVSDTLLLLLTGSVAAPEITAVCEKWPGPVVRAFT